MSLHPPGTSDSLLFAEVSEGLRGKLKSMYHREYDNDPHLGS
jgi:hypothetical protein